MSISDLVTLVITTSSVPSAPSTQLLTAVFESFRKHCLDLLACRIIVVFDTYDSIANKAQLKKGHVTAEGAASFELYKANVKHLVLFNFLGKCSIDDSNLSTSHAEAEFGFSGHAENSIPVSILQTGNQSVTFIEPQQRLGFGLAVRTALRLTTTTYVWVHQHDWTLAADIPLSSIVSVMQDYHEDMMSPVRYVGLPSVRTLSYAVQTDTLRFPHLHLLTKQLKQSFTTSAETGQCKTIPLTPLFFWPDKPHIASTSHYLTAVFPSRTSIGRGDFIEDTIGHVARQEMKEGRWHKWATWLYYPEDGKQIRLRHLDGRVWRGVDGEKKQKLYWQKKMRSEHVTQEEASGVGTLLEASLDGLTAEESGC